MEIPPLNLPLVPKGSPWEKGGEEREKSKMRKSKMEKNKVTREKSDKVKWKQGSSLLLCYFFTLLFCYFAPKGAAAETPLAVISKVEGRVTVKKAEYTKWSGATTGEFLFQGDAIKTGSKSKAVINFVSGVEIDVNENTEFTIKTADEGGTKKEELDMILGEILSKVRVGTDYSVKTPQAVAAVRGTHFGVRMRGAVTEVYVLDGVVDVFNSYGKMSCKKGQKTTVAAGAPPEEPKEAEDAELEEDANWQSDKAEIELKIDLLSEKGFIAGVTLEVTLTAPAEYDGRIDINTNPGDFEVTKVFPLSGGVMKFYCMKDKPGPAVINITGDGIKTIITAINFDEAKEKELKLKLDDGRTLNLKFKK